ncbi:MAG: yncA [Peptococcaceae bacterium]|nr:yncA [Peptococcaceae bacterium]
MAADLRQLMEIEKKCFPECDVFSRRNMRRMVNNPKCSILLDVLEYEQEVVGYAVYLTRRNSQTIRLYSLCLLPCYTGQGLTRKYLEERLKDFALRFSKVILEVRQSNKAAIRLYHGLGFELGQILEGYYADGERGYRMVKNLKPKLP